MSGISLNIIYTSEQILIVGSLTVKVHYKEYNGTLPSIVIDGKGPNLTGRD